MYSPRIKDDQVKKLYILSKKLNLPMTKIVRLAIHDFFKKFKEELKENGKRKK